MVRGHGVVRVRHAAEVGDGGAVPQRLVVGRVAAGRREVVGVGERAVVGQRLAGRLLGGALRGGRDGAEPAVHLRARVVVQVVGRRLSPAAQGVGAGQDRLRLGGLDLGEVQLARHHARHVGLDRRVVDPPDRAALRPAHQPGGVAPVGPPGAQPDLLGIERQLPAPVLAPAGGHLDLRAGGADLDAVPGTAAGHRLAVQEQLPVRAHGLQRRPAQVRPAQQLDSDGGAGGLGVGGGEEEEEGGEGSREAHRDGVGPPSYRRSGGSSPTPGRMGTAGLQAQPVAEVPGPRPAGGDLVPARQVELVAA